MYVYKSAFKFSFGRMHEVTAISMDFPKILLFYIFAEFGGKGGGEVY